MKQVIEFELNQDKVSITVEPIKRLLDVLREDFKLMGTKEGCGEGGCGACAVLIDGKLTNSCIVPVGTIEGTKIMTIEGYQKTKRFEVLQQAYADAGAVQCGFCTPGMLMASEALLSSNPSPREEEIREGISGNLCRCTGYNMIIKAIQQASAKGEGLWK